jgi:hypothetical protein
MLFRVSALVLLLLSECYGQKKLLRAGSPWGDYYRQTSSEPALNVAPGEGRVNQFGVCIAKYTPTGVAGLSYLNDYSAPSPGNASGEWVILLGYPAGARFIQWVGPMSIPSTVPGSACSIEVGSPRALPNVPVGVGNLAWQWHPGGTGHNADNYKFYVTSHVDANPPVNKLWMMSCDPTNPANKCSPANSTEAASTNWVWTELGDYTNSDAQGPYIQWSNAAFCKEITPGETTSCGTGSQQLWPPNSVVLYLISTDGTNFIFSLRRETKNEHGLCEANLVSGRFACAYLDAYGELQGESPNLPACHKGGGGVQSRSVHTSAYWGYQMNGSSIRDTCPGTDLPRWYRALKPTGRVGRFADAVSVNGSNVIAHGAATSVGFTSLGTYGHPSSPPWWGFCPAPFQLSPNYIRPIWAYDVDAPTITEKIVLYLDSCGDFREGIHLGASDRPSRWQLGSAYKAPEDLFPTLPDSTYGLGGKIFVVDTSAPDLGPFAAHPSRFNHGRIRMLAFHNSCENCTTGVISNSVDGYYRQPQAAIGSPRGDGRWYFFFRSTQGGAYPSGYVGNIPGDVVP